MLEHAKTDTIQQPSLWLLYNIAVQPCYFIIPWQHVLSCMWTTLLIYHDGSNNVVQVYLFIKLRIVCSTTGQLNHDVQACQQAKTSRFTCVCVKNPKCSSILTNVPQDPEIPFFPGLAVTRFNLCSKASILTFHTTIVFLESRAYVIYLSAENTTVWKTGFQ